MSIPSLAGRSALTTDSQRQKALDARFVRHGSFWAELDRSGRKKLLSLSRRRLYLEDLDLLFRQGKTDNHAIVLLEGHVKVSVDTSSRQPTVLALRYPGQLLGDEEALQRSGTAVRRVTAQPLGLVEGLVIEAEVFQSFLDDHPAGWPAIATDRGHRIVETETRLGDQSSKAANQRLAAVLSSLIDHQTAVREGTSTIMLPLTQTELASLICASRETVERILRNWRERAIVATAYRSITVLRPDLLMRIAGTRSVFRPPSSPGIGREQSRPPSTAHGAPLAS